MTWSCPRNAEEWFFRMASGAVGERDRAAFDAWLDEDPNHLKEYERVERVLRVAEHAAPYFQEAPGEDTGFLFQMQKLLFTGRPSFRITAACAAGILIVLAMSWQFLGPGQVPAEVYQTAIGKNRTIELSDGSLIDMNTQTSLRISVNEKSRRVIMESGEAYFSIAQDEGNPFIVQVGQREVRVVGTAFNISFLDRRAEVTVIEGAVEVTGTGGMFDKNRNDTAVLQAGTRGFYSEKSPLKMTKDAATDLVTAWREGRFIFEKTPLSSVVRELGRYYDANIIVTDVYAGSFVVTAVIDREDIRSTLGKLEKLLPVKVNYVHNTLVELSWDRAK